MTLKDLADAAGIKRVVWIDDLFDPPNELAVEADLRALVARARARDLTVIINGHNMTPDGSVDEWMSDIEDLRDAGMSVDAIVSLLRERLAEGEAAPRPDYNDSSIAEIVGSFGEEMVTRASASKWGDIKPTLSDAERTLVIIDREFPVDGVAIPLGENILQDVVKAQFPSVHVVMLTRSVDEDPEVLRKDLANRLDIPFQDFGVSAKMVSGERGQAESSLCNAFQVVFTHQVCITLTRRIHDVAKKELETTVEALSSQSVYDLDRVVFDNSLIEGASELDVLTRMLLLRQRVAVDTELGPSEEYFDLLAKLRSLRALAGPLTSIKHGNPVMLERWRRDEVCDPGEWINPAHAPLACGDVFVRSESSEVFVLLGQPCDMAVRPNGRRKTHEAIFARAKKWRPEQERRKRTGFIGSAHHFFPIPSLPIVGKDRWRLDFREWASVNLRLLDFSVFSGTGAVRLDVTVEPPVFLLPGWRKLLDSARCKITTEAQLPAEYAALSLSESLKKKSASKDSGVVALPYSRAGRLREPWAVAAYAAFASYQARAAFDHDFAKVLPETMEQ